jgi:hypothetical protein
MKKLNQKSINKIIFYKLFESDMLSQPQIDTKTNTQMSNDSVVTSVPTNKPSVKNNLKRASDNPLRAWGDDEMDEYYRWLDQQMQEWERDNPRPEWVDGMSQEEWEALIMLWEWYYNEHRYGVEHTYAWNFPGTNDGLLGQIPQRNPLPKPKQKEPTWSPAPWWVPEPFQPNPNWWHMGPDETGPV